MWDEELFFYWLRSQVKAAGTGPSIAHPNKFCFLEENTMKKHDMMKKCTAAALSLTMMAGRAACSGGSSSASSGAAPAPAVSGSETGGTAIKVAVVKQMDHASLDEIANAITARLDEIAAEVKQIATSHPMFSSEWVAPSIRKDFEDMYYNVEY